MRTFRKALSILLCFVMLFTTFCFFPLTGLNVEADAASITGEGSRTAFYAPEVIYLYPNVTSWKEATATSFQYYVGNSVNTADIYTAPTAVADTSSKGVLYFATEEGMNDVNLSYTFQNMAGNGIEGGNVDFTMTEKNGYYEIAIAGGMSPTLGAADSGCFLVWNMQYTTDKGEHKAAFAITYVYKPYVVSYGAVARVANTQGQINVDNENITWVTGVHSIDVNASAAAALYPYYTTVDAGKDAGKFAFSPFLSKDNKAYVGTRAVSGQAPVANGGYNAVFSASASEIAYFYAGQDGAPMTAHYRADQKWFTNAKTAEGSVKSDIYTDGTFDFSGSSSVAAKNATAVVTPTRLGAVTIDTSRYTNLNQIPNLAVGFMITSTDIRNGGNISAGGDATGYWVIGDYTDKGTAATGTYTDQSSQSDALNAVNTVYAEAQGVSFPTANGIKYAGAWSNEINKEESFKKYTVKSIVKIDDKGEYEYSVTASTVGLNATQIDKGALRETVYEASALLGTFGTKRNGMSLYYSAEEGSAWHTFAAAYVTAYKVLTQLDASAEAVSSAQAALEASLSELLSGKDLKVLFDVNYDGINPNLLAASDNYSSEGYSITYNAATEAYVFNGTIHETSRNYIADASIDEGAYTVTADYMGGTRTVASGVSSTVALEFFAGDNQLDPRKSKDMYGNGGSFTYDIDMASADAINNFRFWFWVNGQHQNAVTFANYSYKLKLEKGSTATAYSPAAKIADGTTYGTLPAPQREGFTFGGWYGDEALTTEITAESAISARVLYAKWIPNVYSLSFENLFNLNAWATEGNAIRTASGASSGNNAVYNSDTNSVTIVSDAKAGECYTTYNADCYSVKVLPNTSYRFSYKISDRNDVGTTIVFAFLFDANGNSIGFKDNDNYASKSKTVAANGEYYIDFTTGENADIFRCRFGTYSGTDGDVSVEATFSDVKLVEVNDYNNALEISDPEKTYDYGTTYGELATATREGYVFEGWYTGKNGTGEKITASTAVKSENLTLYSNWVANGYTVKFNSNGADYGADPAPVTCVYDVEFTLPAVSYLRTGYAFAGWSTTPDGDVLYTDKQTVKNVTAEENGEVTLYAVWTPNKFNVQFNANTGTGTMAPVQVAYQSGTALPECGFTKTGYSFVGWAASSAGNIITQAQFNTLSSVAGDVITLYAIWSENTYSVTYNANGGEGSSFTQEYLYSYEFELPSTGFTKTGYILSGWTTAPDGQKLYNAGQRVSGLNTDKNGNVALYAVWSPVTYKIKFDAAAGSGSMDAITATYDAEAILPACEFTRYGYHFIGWTTVAGGDAEYKAGDKALNLCADQNGEVTLYAVWEINSYEVKLEFRGADGVIVNKTINVNHGDSVQNLSIEGFTAYPRSTGTKHYVFSGWNTASGAIANVTGNMSVKAIYGADADCTLSTATTPSTCAVKGKDVTTCAYCSYEVEKELPLIPHSYNAGEITTPATCLTDGVKTFTCTVCADDAEGHTKTEVVKAIGHTFTDKNETESTCAAQGYEAHRFCTVCEKAFAPDATIWEDDVFEDYLKEAVPHTEGDDATCTTDKICTVCFTVLEPAFGHTFTETYEASTKVDCSTTKGNYTIVRTCSVCSTVEREDVVNDFLPHTYTVETIAPTCTEAGYDLHTCTVCGHEEKDNFVDATGHNDEGNTWVVKTPATCTEDGEEVILCSICGEASQTKSIDKLGHTSGEWAVTTEPTCTTEGVNSHYCTVCKEVYETEAIATIAHTYEWVVIAEPDCTTDGMKHFKCSCGKVNSTQVLPRLGHSKDGEATCEKDSICLRCDEVLKEALGHDWNNGVIIKDPTETEQGEREYTCLRDSSHKKYETIPVRIVITLPEIPADGTYDLDASETLYLGNIHDIISVEAGIAYTVSVDNANILTINENGYMMAVKDGNAVITITTNDGKYQKHLPVTVRTYKTITFDVNGVLTTIKAYVGDKFDTIEVASFEDEYGYIRSFKAWLIDGAVVTDFTCTGDMTLVAQFTSSCDYTRFDKMAIVFEGLIGGYYDNAELITLNKQEVENAKALIAEFRADRNIRDSAEQGRVDAAANQISITVAKIYPEDGASIEIRGATDCKAGTYAEVKAYLMPLGLELADGVWTSSDTSIGFFVNGRFFAVKTGTVTLTVSRGNLSASVTINVTATGGARVIFFDSLLTNANYIVEGGYVIKNTANIFWAPDAEINFRVITDGTFEEYTVYINDKKVEPDITGTYTIPANTGDAHVRVEGMVPDYSDENPDANAKVSIWDMIRNFFKKIGDFFRNLFS